MLNNFLYMKIEKGRNLPLMHFPAGSYKHRNVVVWKMFSVVSQKRSRLPRLPLGRTTVLGYFSLRSRGEPGTRVPILPSAMGTWSHSEYTLHSAWDNLAHTEYAADVHAVYFCAPISKMLGFLQYDFWLTGKESGHLEL